MYELLQTINDPAELRKLERRQLHQLAEELRAFVLDSVSRTGGHLSSNLGTVELTIALHYVFETPEDRIVWDVGHQTYPHKILTGRRERMPTLRQLRGVSGFPPRSVPCAARGCRRCASWAACRFSRAAPSRPTTRSAPRIPRRRSRLRSGW